MSPMRPRFVTDLPNLPPRAPDSHKGTFGRALLIGGSRGMSGAISLAGRACLRSGAGLVTLATAETCVDTVAGFDPCYMTVPLTADAHGRIGPHQFAPLEPYLARSRCVAIGPGLGQSTPIEQLVRRLHTTVKKTIVLDADAINSLANSERGLHDAAGPRILTPHPGEFERLRNAHPMDVSQFEPHGLGSLDLEAVAMAAALNLVIVLKGHETLITDGHACARNTTGNPGMASGGSGDVLTGVITALKCQGLSAFEAAHLGVYVHGLAGDLAVAELGQVSLIATDLVQFLPAAFQSLHPAK